MVMRTTLRVPRPGLVVLVAAVLAILAPGIGARPAQATLLTACQGSNIHGTASSLQGIAQGIWTTTGFNSSATGCKTDPLTPTVTASSSDQCLLDWHADGTAFDTSFSFCGSDAPPTTAQIHTVNTTVATGGSGAAVQSIPVAQSAIAIVVNPPSGCTINSATATNVEKVFRGTFTTWSQLGATGCGTATITPVVRDGWDGETFQFKRWLTTQFAGNVTTSPNRSWIDLQKSSTNTVWPGSPARSQSGCTMGSCDGGSGFGDEDAVQTAGNTTGSITFAALSAARKKYMVHTYPFLKWISIQLETGSPIVNPSANGLSDTKSRSTCSTASNVYGTLPANTAATWATVTNTTPSGVAVYPICTLTYVLALSAYTPKWGSTNTLGRTTATTVSNYLNYVATVAGGQTDALTTDNDYAPLPPDVRDKALTGLTAITD
jgi:ABC-type phosphate transport system substrate-binding protein